MSKCNSNFFPLFSNPETSITRYETAYKYRERSRCREQTNAEEEARVTLTESDPRFPTSHVPTHLSSTEWRIARTNSASYRREKERRDSRESDRGMINERFDELEL